MKDFCQLNGLAKCGINKDAIPKLHSSNGLMLSLISRDQICMDWVVKMPKIYFKMLNNPSLSKDILSLLYKYANIFVIGLKKMHPIIAHNRPSK